MQTYDLYTVVMWRKLLFLKHVCLTSFSVGDFLRWNLIGFQSDGKDRHFQPQRHEEDGLIEREEKETLIDSNTNILSGDYSFIAT